MLTGLKTRQTLILFAVLAAFLAQGCAGKKPVADTGPVFFPPPPNEPRIQYLTAINGSGDLEEKKSDFSIFVTGQTDEQQILIAKPYGVTSHGGKIYVCDIIQGRIHVIDPVARNYEFFRGDTGAGKVKKPVNLTFDPDGNMYVVDILRQEVLIYNADGQFTKAIGKEQKMRPVDVLADDRDIYVLDLDGNNIKVFDRKSFKLVKSIGSPEGGKGLAGPTNFTMDKKGNIYVTNIGTSNVVKLDKDGHVLDSFGEMGDAFGNFVRPKGIAVDDLGRIYVVDGAFQNVQIFNENKRLLMFFGSPGPDVGRASMNLPVGISVTRENIEFFKKYADPSFEVEYLILVANQFGIAKVGVYGLGHKKGSQPASSESSEKPKSEDKGAQPADADKPAAPGSVTK